MLFGIPNLPHQSRITVDVNQASYTGDAIITTTYGDGMME